MTEEERQNRSSHPKVRELKEKICTKDSDKEYLFVSYKSDDWETVLTEIVYKLVNEYGLNVYYDGSFDHHNDSWIKQMPDNMDSPFCVGVLAFLDDNYATSYAALMELMHSQTFNADTTDSGGLPIIPVNLDNLHKISGIEGSKDTGLGVVTFTDGSQNINAEAERDRFERDYEEVCELSFIKREFKVYDKEGIFTKRHCSTMVRELLASKGYNSNMFDNTNGFFNNLVKTIKSTCGNKVFSDVPAVKKPIEQPEPVNKASVKKAMVKTAPVTAKAKIKDRNLVIKLIRYQNGDIYNGEVKDEIPNGHGAMKYSNRDVYEGNFVNGKPNGQGVFYDHACGIIYTGEFKDGKPNGQGIMQDSNGDVYEGNFADYKLEGHSVIKYEDGAVFEGEFIDNEPSGSGVYTYSKYAEDIESISNIFVGRKSFDVGDFTGICTIQSRLSGRGCMQYKDGGTYTGEFKDGKRHGHGKMVHKSGVVSDGKWKENLFLGRSFDA